MFHFVQQHEQCSFPEAVQHIVVLVGLLFPYFSFLSLSFPLFPSLLFPSLFRSFDSHLHFTISHTRSESNNDNIMCLFYHSSPLTLHPTLSPLLHPPSYHLHLSQASLNITITQADGYGLPLTDDQRRLEEANQRAEAEVLQRRNRQERILLLAASYYTAKVTICYQCYYYCYYCYNYHRYNNYCCCCCC